MKLEEIALENILINMTCENALDIVRSIPETIIQNKQNTHNWTFLHRVVNLGSSEAAKYLIDKGFKVDVQDKYGRTPLHKAAEGNYSECIEILVNNGANVNAIDHYGATALHLAAERGNSSAVKVLLDSKPDMNAKTVSNLTALSLATRVGSLECVELLLKSGVEVDVFDQQGCTALGWVCADLQSACVQNLADFDRIEADLKMINLLKEYGAETLGENVVGV